MTQETNDLALEIAHCPVVSAVLEGQRSPCRSVVMFQKRPAKDRWVPEPWSGHLDRARILFLSSNPSSGDPDEPVASGDLTASASDEPILNTFDRAFDDGPWIGVTNGTHLRAADGTRGKFVPYWASCKSRASELLGSEAHPGIDYALTEVVHCGSQHELGVQDAAIECVPRYLNRVVGSSPATVVVVVGAVARAIVRLMVPALAGDSLYVGPVSWAQRQRHVLFLPHPNARGVSKGVAAYLGEGAEHIMKTLRTALTA